MSARHDSEFPTETAPPSACSRHDQPSANGVAVSPCVIDVEHMPTEDAVELLVTLARHHGLTDLTVGKVSIKLEISSAFITGAMGAMQEKLAEAMEKADEKRDEKRRVRVHERRLPRGSG